MLGSKTKEFMSVNRLARRQPRLSDEPTLRPGLSIEAIRAPEDTRACADLLP